MAALAPPHPKPYTPKKTERTKTMTAVVGFPYRDGMILSADSQATYATGMKEYSRKVFALEGVMIPCAYGSAGEAGLGLEIRDKLSRKIQELDPAETSLDSIQLSAEQVVDSLGRIHAQLGVDFLLAAHTAMSGPVLIHFDGQGINPATKLTVVGCGNESLLKFLSKKIYRPNLSRQEAIALAGYMTKQAAEYVGNCGLPVEGFLVTADGVESVDEWLKIGSELIENQIDSDLSETLTKSFSL